MLEVFSWLQVTFKRKFKLLGMAFSSTHLFSIRSLSTKEIVPTCCWVFHFLCPISICKTLLILNFFLFPYFPNHPIFRQIDLCPVPQICYDLSYLGFPLEVPSVQNSSPFSATGLHWTHFSKSNSSNTFSKMSYMICFLIWDQL